MSEELRVMSDELADAKKRSRSSLFTLNSTLFTLNSSLFTLNSSLLTLLLALLTPTICAQPAPAPAPAPAPQWLETIAPGFDTLARNPVEYRRVLDKFTEAVVRMSVRECAVVYYGFPMQKGFVAAPPGEEDMQRAIMAEDYQTAYTIGTQILETTPVNLTALYWTLFAATETNRPWEILNSLRGRYNTISHIISLSGDGTSPPSSLRVVWSGDMYTYTMLELGLTIGEGFLWDNRWTEFEVTPSGPGGRFKNSSIFFEQWTGK